MSSVSLTATHLVTHLDLRLVLDWLLTCCVFSVSLTANYLVRLNICTFLVLGCLLDNPGFKLGMLVLSSSTYVLSPPLSASHTSTFTFIPTTPVCHNQQYLIIYYISHTCLSQPTISYNLLHISHQSVTTNTIL